MISAITKNVVDFFAPATLTVEKTLADKKLIIPSGSREVEVCDQRFVKDLPTLEDVWTTGIKANDASNESRGFPLCLVLGPSGSGKTCFALKYLTKGFLDTMTKERVAVYLQPAANLSINWNKNNEFAAKELINEVKERCARKIEKEIHGKLDMHVCLIFDEAGSSHTQVGSNAEKIL